MLSVRMTPASSLVPYAKNARTHSPEQIAQIAASIREFGFTNPVLVDREGGIIAGHGRVLAAKDLGLKEVPTIKLGHLTDAQKRAYVIADNKLALNAGWDFATLATELIEIDTGDFDMSLLGFSEQELEQIATWAPENSGHADPDETPAAPVVAMSRAGDVWILGRHRIICGDSTKAEDVAAVLAGVKPLLMVTDPPYGVEYDPSWRADRGVNKAKGKLGKVLNDDRADWSEAWALFPGDVAYVWCASMFNDVVIQSLEASGFERRSHIIWAKDRFTLGRGHYHWQHEPCWYVVRGTGHWHGNRAQSTVWQIAARDDSGHGHSTQKPVECMRRPIENNSAPGQAVYEPFSGSGTTIIAAEQTGRACYAIELNPAYVDVAVLRWQKFAAGTAILEGDGRTFEEIAAERMKAAA